MPIRQQTRSAALRCIVLCGVALAPSCQGQGGLLVPERGLVPRADARVADHDGKVVMLPFAGEPVTLALDASHSTDPDGTIVKYRWLSGTRAQPAAGAGAVGTAGMGTAGMGTAGMGTAGTGPTRSAGAAAPPPPRSVPADASPDWPDDIEKPNVQLDEEGSYAFTLWVIDDRGLVSAPDTVRVVVTRMPTTEP